MSQAALDMLDERSQGAKPRASASKTAIGMLDERASNRSAAFSDELPPVPGSQEEQDMIANSRPMEEAYDTFGNEAGRYFSRINKAAGEFNVAPDAGPLGMLDAAGTLLTGGIAAPVLGTAESMLLGTNPEEAFKRYTWQPRTASGKAQLGMLDALVSPLTESGADIALAPLAAEAQALTHGAPRAVGPSEVPGASIAPDVNSIPLGESGGAAAARVDLTQVSQPLKEKLLAEYHRGNLNAEVAKAHIEADSLPVPIKLTKGQATQDPVVLSEERNSRAKNPEFAHLYNEQNRQLIDNLDEIRMNVAQGSMGMDHVQNGQALIDAYKTMDERVRADIDTKYQALRDASGGEFPIGGKTLMENVEAALHKKLLFEHAPTQIMSQLERFTKEQMNFEQFEALRTNLSRIQRSPSVDGNTRAAAGIIRSEMEALPLVPRAAKLKPIADEARAAARQRFERMESDPAYRAAADDSVGAGEASPLADSFVDKYVVKGKKAHLRTMRENLAGDDAAQQTISAGALNYLKSKSGVDVYTNEGNFSQAGYNKALADITPKFDELFDADTADTLQVLGGVARKIQARPSGSFVNESNTFTAAMGSHVANVLEGAANVKAGGLPIGTYARKGLERRAEKKFVQKSLEPGAGVALKDVLKGKKK